VGNDMFTFYFCISASWEFSLREFLGPREIVSPESYKSV
jgi:hypothetical protein